MFIIHHRFAAMMLTMNTKRTKRRRRKEQKRRKKKVYDGDDGSDIFTQPNHTNRTIEIHTRTKNNVGSKTYQLEKKTLWFFFTFCLNAKI
jgi:hypothetical protein